MQNMHVQTNVLFVAQINERESERARERERDVRWCVLYCMGRRPAACKLYASCTRAARENIEHIFPVFYLIKFIFDPFCLNSRVVWIFYSTLVMFVCTCVHIYFHFS